MEKFKSLGDQLQALVQTQDGHIDKRLEKDGKSYRLQRDFADKLIGNISPIKPILLGKGRPDYIFETSVPIPKHRKAEFSLKELTIPCGVPTGLLRDKKALESEVEKTFLGTFRNTISTFGDYAVVIKPEILVEFIKDDQAFRFVCKYDAQPIISKPGDKEQNSLC